MPTALSLVTDMTEFETGEAAALALADEIDARLRAALEARGAASLVVSGGSSPKRLYQLLSERDLDWSKVTVVLADERWVDPGLAGSNETFLRETLLQGRAADARFIGLKTPHATPQAGLETVNQRLESAPRPFDVVVVGMGGDGHTLSWFPDAKGLEDALTRDGGLAAAVTAHQSEVTGPFTERMTLTHGALSGAGFCALLISGEAKRAVWRDAAGPGLVSRLPIRALMRADDLTLNTYWWP